MYLIPVGNKLTTMLPALGSLARMGGLPTTGKLLRLTKHSKIPFTLIALKKHYDEWGQTRESPLDSGVFYGEWAIKVLLITKRGLKLVTLYQPTSQLVSLMAVSSIAIRAGQAVKATKKKEKLDLASHLLAITATLAKWHAKSLSIHALGKGATVLGSGIELWLVLHK